jgi:hypothetical protein
MKLSALLLCLVATSAIAVARGVSVDSGGQTLGPERAVFQTSFGDLVFGFYPEVRAAVQS